MQNFKQRLYDYETPAPEGIWKNINKELHNDEKIVKIGETRKKSRLLFYGLTAAASLAAIFIINFVFNKKEIKPIANAPVLKVDNMVTQKVKDSIALNHQILERIINTAPEDKKILASNFEKHGDAKKYITIAGPEGQPVKISAKAATLIVSADDEFPPKPIWNKKIDKWKQIMLSNTTSPTATSLVDILQLAAHSDNVE